MITQSAWQSLSFCVIFTKDFVSFSWMLSWMQIMIVEYFFVVVLFFCLLLFFCFVYQSSLCFVCCCSFVLFNLNPFFTGSLVNLSFCLTLICRSSLAFSSICCSSLHLVFTVLVWSICHSSLDQSSLDLHSVFTLSIVLHWCWLLLFACWNWKSCFCLGLCFVFYCWHKLSFVLV